MNEITEAERVERVCGKLVEKARTMNRAAGPLLGPPGFVSREFLDDMRELLDYVCERIEEYAMLLEEAARTGKLGAGG